MFLWRHITTGSGHINFHTQLRIDFTVLYLPNRIAGLCVQYKLLLRLAWPPRVHKTIGLLKHLKKLLNYESNSGLFFCLTLCYIGSYWMSEGYPLTQG